MPLGSDPSPTRGVRVLIVDDQAVFRGVAQDVIAATGGFELVGEAANGEEALDAVDRLLPDLVLLDVRLRGLSGFSVARRITASHPDVVVVLISVDELVDVPGVVPLTDVPLLRKQDFGPGLLRRVWTERGR
jgi:CheY-like chemotaxis protein